MKKKGFTLIELLVVVGIMAMLAALAVIALNNARQRARDTRRLADVKQIQTALELYYLDNNQYPAGSAVVLAGKCLSTSAWTDACSGTTYMAAAPTNPTPWGEGSCSDATTVTEYFYTADDPGSSGSNVSYHITYCLAGDTGQIPGGDHTATPAGLADDR